MARLRFPRQLTAVLALCLRAALAGSAVAAAGCTHVAPYERGAIARPEMTTSDLSGRAGRHATAVHEGAAPGGDVAESGCGCN